MAAPHPRASAVCVYATTGDVALLTAAVSVIAFFFTSTSLPAGWTTLSVLIALLAAVQLLTTKVIGIYVGAIFDEVEPLHLYRPGSSDPNREVSSTHSPRMTARLD